MSSGQFPTVNRFPFKVFTVSKKNGKAVGSSYSFEYPRSVSTPVPGTVYWDHDGDVHDYSITTARSVHWGENTVIPPFDDAEERDDCKESVVRILGSMRSPPQDSTIASNTSLEEGENEEHRHPIELDEARRELFIDDKGESTIATDEETTTTDFTLQPSGDNKSVMVPPKVLVSRRAKPTARYSRKRRDNGTGVNKRDKNFMTSRKKRDPLRQAHKQIHFDDDNHAHADAQYGMRFTTNNNLDRCEYLYNLSLEMQADGRQRREAIAKTSFEKQRMPYPEDFGTLPMLRATDMYDKGIEFLRSRHVRLEKKREVEEEEILAKHKFKLARGSFYTPASQTSWKCHKVPRTRAGDLYYRTTEALRLKQEHIAHQNAFNER